MTESMEDDCAIPELPASCRSTTSEALGPCISPSGTMSPHDINTNSEKKKKHNYSPPLLKMLNSALFHVGELIDYTAQNIAAMCEPLIMKTLGLTCWDMMHALTHWYIK